VRAQGAEALHKIVMHGEHRFGEYSHPLYRFLRARTTSSRAARSGHYLNTKEGERELQSLDPYSACAGFLGLFQD
jgi:hypothetical protein